MYTREYVLSMVAGRELDALVQKTIDPEGVNYWPRQGGGAECYDIEGNQIPWEPSTEITAAYEVLASFDDYGVVHTPTRGHYCFIQTTRETYTSPSCGSASEAICKAALLSLLKED